ncbi:sel1 repeat family protein [Helicobacter pylori]|uniref:tetratricopeptide repeat protein n=1 Tax=Helicobacter pylori TaxID=210 RepID=UPI0013F4921B|nr:tetratricopeptide repeat protein [Helicobacter pylori]NHB24110.1 sel1 repeat family protein [Helicobacter pylori]NHB55189.1 sel1 repeat family protein [Helicobacter pylori]
MASQTPKELFDLSVKSNKAKDFTQAKKYFEKACNLNYAKGCVSLVGLYEGENLVIGENPSEKLVKERLKKAAQYYSKACDLKNDFGCSTLGAMQYIGKGVVKNEKQAAEKFEKACQLGHKEACEMVTYKGLCELGHKEACEIFSLEVLCKLSDLKACDLSYDKKKALGF